MQEQSADPGQVVPITFALSPEQALVVSYAESNASEVRLALLRPGDDAELTKKQRVYQARAGSGALPVSQRLLLAIADRDVASSAAALVQEGEGLEVVAVVDEPEEVSRALRRHDVDVVVLHDALGAVPVLDLARELGQAFPETGLVLIAAEDSPGPAARGDAGRPARRRRAAAVARAARGQRARRGAVVARAARPRDRRGVGRGRARRPADRRRGRQGRRRDDDGGAPARARAIRAQPGPARLRRRLRPAARATCARSSTCPHRRSVVDLVEVAAEISVRHLQETLYTHNEGFRVLLAPEEGERAEEVDSGVARSVLNAVKARHALTVVDLGAQVSEASAIGAEIANGVVSSRRPTSCRCAACGACATCGGGSQVRDDDDVHVVLNRTSRKLEIQPDLARKVVGAPLAQTTIPDDFCRVRDRRQHRRADRAWRTASCAAPTTRWPPSSACCPAAEEAGGGGRRGARPALAARRRARPVLRSRSWACCRC